MPNLPTRISHLDITKGQRSPNTMIAGKSLQARITEIILVPRNMMRDRTINNPLLRLRTHQPHNSMPIPRSRSISRDLPPRTPQQQHSHHGRGSLLRRSTPTTAFMTRGPSSSSVSIFIHTIFSNHPCELKTPPPAKTSTPHRSPPRP
jgi:hypothetical protein